MRLRSLTRWNATQPARSPSDLDHEPAERLRLALGALDLCNHVVAGLARATAEKRPRVLVRDQLEQKIGVVGTGTAKLDACHVWDARRRRSRDGAKTARSERNPAEDQREAAERSDAEALTEEDRAVRERDRRDEIRDERRIGGTRARDQPEEQKVSESSSRDAEREHRPDHLPARERDAAPVRSRAAGSRASRSPSTRARRHAAAPFAGACR